jgi:hypothetical protein
MKKEVLIGLAILSLTAGGASAAGRLSDLQLDRVTAGLVLPDCPGCTLASSNGTSTNGITVSNSTITKLPQPTPPPPPSGGTGGTGGTGGSGGSSSGGGNAGPSGPSVFTTTGTVPANLAAIVNGASIITIQ